MRTTDMAAILRRAGLKVVEVPGWQARGHGALASVSAIICHHTATDASARGNYPTLATVRDGRAGLAGPLAQLGLGRDGTWYVIAAGVAWHAGATQYTWQNNWHAIGVEAEAEGTGDPRDWPKAQMDSYAAGVATLAKAFGVPNSRVLGHKEVASAKPGDPPNGRKIDPSFDMDAFRARVRNPPSTTPGGFMSDLSAEDQRAMLWNVRQIKKHLDEQDPILWNVRQIKSQVDELTRANRAQTAAIEALAKNAGLDPKVVTAAIDKALENITIVLTSKES